MKKFNTNDYIYIQITEAGWEYILRNNSKEYIAICIDSQKIIFGDEYWHRMQAHEVFALLPPVFGSALLYKTSILIDDNDLYDVDTK